MDTASFQRRLLERAVQVMGGPAALSLRLGVHEHWLEVWTKGGEAMPGRVFIALADLVLEDDIARAAQDRRGLPRLSGSPGIQAAVPRRGQ